MSKCFAFPFFAVIFLSESFTPCFQMCVFLDRIVKKKKKDERKNQSIYASSLVVNPKWQKLCTSRIALSRTLTWLARVNSEKKQAESASLQCDHWETLQRSNSSTCTNTRAKTQCRQLPHTHKHCILHNALQSAFVVNIWCLIYTLKSICLP